MPGGVRAVLGALAAVVPVAHLDAVARLVPVGLCPALLGVEYGGGGARKAKWYFRACQGLSLVRLERLAARCGPPDALRTFIRVLLGGAAHYPERGVMLYLSHDLAGQVGLNVYLSGPTAEPGERELAHRVRQAHTALGLDASTYEAVLARLRRDTPPETRLHTLTGLKLSAAGVSLNQYLCPASPEDPSGGTAHQAGLDP